jgi:hypothetical protein
VEDGYGVVLLRYRWLRAGICKMSDEYKTAQFSWPPLYDPEFVKTVREVLRSYYPVNLDEASDAEIMELMSRLICENIRELDL